MLSRSLKLAPIRRAIRNFHALSTHSQATTLQFTPKFGSFKLAEPAAACIQIPTRKNKEEKRRESQRWEWCVVVKIVVMGVLVVECSFG